MSKKKSLGSSPIGYKSDNGSKMGFIPDLGVSAPDADKQKRTRDKRSSPQERGLENFEKTSEKNQKTEKKIVSYNLEVSLIDTIKSTAEDKGMYYSGLVNMALKRWLSEHS